MDWFEIAVTNGNVIRRAPGSADPAAPLDRYNMIGSILDIADPGSILVDRDNAIVRVQVFTGSNNVADTERRERFAP